MLIEAGNTRVLCNATIEVGGSGVDAELGQGLGDGGVWDAAAGDVDAVSA